MKKTFASTLFAVLISISSFAEKGLVVTQKVMAGDAKMQILVTWYVTETHCKMKMEFSDGKVKSTNWFIANPKEGILFMYTEGAVPPGVEKMYFSIPVHDINPSKSLHPSRVKVESTGQSQTLAGMLCERIIARSNKTSTEMWVSTSFKPNFYQFYSFFQDSYELMALAEENIPGIPLSSVTKDMSGKIISSSEVISASFKELSERDFVVPAEYKSNK